MGLSSRRGIAALGALASVGVLAGGMYLAERALALKHKVNTILHNQELILDGYRRHYPVAAAADESVPRVIFVGHVYDHNGLPVAGRAVEEHPERPFRFLRRWLASEPARALVFGGDSIREPDADSLRWLQELRADLPMARFVLGNHENVDAFWEAHPEEFATLFRSRYWQEDLDGVRMIYLDTTLSAAGLALGAAQRTFLAEALDGASYRYALVFLHHPLWSDHVKHGIAEPTEETARAMNRDWREQVVPLLARGKVKGVFAGDSGACREDPVGTIRHFCCGWHPDGPIAWLAIDLGPQAPQVTFHRLDQRRHLVRH